MRVVRTSNLDLETSRPQDLKTLDLVVNPKTRSFDQVEVRIEDDVAVDNTTELVIFVEHFKAPICANWTLYVRGNIATEVAPICGP